MADANLSVSLSGDPKTGKTHFALTFPDPIAVFSFDQRGAEVLLPKFPNKRIDIFKFDPPVSASLHPDTPYAMTLWNNIKAKYIELTGSGEYKTFVLDPATILWEIIRHAFAEQEGKDDIGRARNYGEPNARMSWMILSPLPSGHNVVCLQYIKDRYVSDTMTGEKEVDGFKRTGGLTDVGMWFSKVTKPASADQRKRLGKKEVSVVNARVTECRFDMEVEGIVLENPSYDDLMNILGV